MKFIILDRDGVINHDSDHFIKSEDEWQPIPGSLEAIARLHHAGFRIAVATNQSGIARGLYSIAVLDAMHEKMRRLLADMDAKVDAIFYCPHGPNDQCRCRKPLPGMYLTAAEQLGFGLNGVPVVGDSWRDLEAAIAVNAQPILVKTGKGRRTLAAQQDQIQAANIPVYENLSEFTDSLLNE